MENSSRIQYRTHAAFTLPGRRGWSWVTWTSNHASKHAAIIAKAEELNATGWDFGQADHDEVSRSRW